MEVVWKLLYIRQKGKNEKLQTALRNTHKENKAIKKDMRKIKRKNFHLKRALEDATEGFETEYCSCCGYEQTFFWNREAYGIHAFCPYCGERLMLCSSCEGACDYNSFTNTCKEMKKEEQI